MRLENFPNLNFNPSFHPRCRVVAFSLFLARKEAFENIHLFPKISSAAFCLPLVAVAALPADAMFHSLILRHVDNTKDDDNDDGV